jgi:putative transposase
MHTSTPTNPYKHHRFPAEIISHGVWLYFRFCLSYRDVEELLFARGIIVTYEAIRKWCLKFGQPYANLLRHRHPRPGDKWHLDEVFLTIHGERHYLWRAVDQDGYVLDILVQRRRNKAAAKKFFRKGFPIVMEKFCTRGRDPRRRWREVTPAAWFLAPLHVV